MKSPIKTFILLFIFIPMSAIKGSEGPIPYLEQVHLPYLEQVHRSPLAIPQMRETEESRPCPSSRTNKDLAILVGACAIPPIITYLSLKEQRKTRFIPGAESFIISSALKLVSAGGMNLATFVAGAVAYYKFRGWLYGDCADKAALKKVQAQTQAHEALLHKLIERTNEQGTDLQNYASTINKATSKINTLNSPINSLITQHNEDHPEKKLPSLSTKNIPALNQQMRPQIKEKPSGWCCCS